MDNFAYSNLTTCWPEELDVIMRQVFSLEATLPLLEAHSTYHEQKEAASNSANHCVSFGLQCLPQLFSYLLSYVPSIEAYTFHYRDCTLHKQMQTYCQLTC